MPDFEHRRARSENFPALQQRLALYQYELSDISQDADDQARYGYHLERHRLGERFHAHVARVSGQYVDFALVAPAAVTRRQGHWMKQFFVLKRYRRAGLGRAFATQVLRAHPGPWEVGQMPANAAARAFWQQEIGDLTGAATVPSSTAP